MQFGADYDLTIPSCSSAIEPIEIEPQPSDIVNRRDKLLDRVLLSLPSAVIDSSARAPFEPIINTLHRLRYLDTTLGPTALYRVLSIGSGRINPNSS